MQKREVITGIDPDYHAGDGICDFNLMASGKDFRIWSQLQNINDMNQHRAPTKQIGFIVINTNADTSTPGGTTCSRRVGRFEAYTVPKDKPEVAIDEIRRLDREKGFVHVVLWNELQFFGPEVIPVLLRLKQDGRAQWLAGLDSDFRGEPYFFISQIADLFTYRIVGARANCTFVDPTTEEQCSAPAIQNIRLLRRESGLLYPDMRGAEFYKRENGSPPEKVQASYAPYWHPTTLLKGTPGIEYTIACADHAMVPRASETKKVLESIRKNRSRDKKLLESTFSGYEDLGQILDFLIKERGIRYDDSRKLYIATTRVH